MSIDDARTVDDIDADIRMVAEAMAGYRKWGKKTPPGLRSAAEIFAEECATKFRELLAERKEAIRKAL